MTTARRTDVHSPSNLVTEDYDFLGCGDFGAADEPGYSPLMTPYAQQLLTEGWRFADVETNGDCQHCGARLRYFAVLLHTPSKCFVRVGETCLDNRFELATGEFHKLRKAAKLNRERRVMREVRAEFAADHADVIGFLSEKMTECESRFGYLPDPELDGYLPGVSFWEFYLSLYARLERTGLLSERQVEALRKSAVKDAARKVAREEERKDSEPVPMTDEKIVVTGEITKLDLKDDGFGGTREVMTVKDDRGFLLWGTQPTKLYEAKVGSRVTFTATVQRSDRDNFFGFFKRPSQASVVGQPA